MENLKFICVHGLSGWGSYDEQNERLPYWGLKSGDILKKLGEQGYAVFSASVAPHGSAYDRACELYAQLSGTIVDYGKTHSEMFGHARFGTDFRGRALIDAFDENTKLVLIGHSFGGATIRLFAHILEKGIKEECIGEHSAFFDGNRAGNIFSIMTVAAPHNGTTAYDLYEDPFFDTSAVKLTLKEKLAAKLMSRTNSADDRELPSEDCAAFDMHIDNARKLNEKLSVNENIYYFSQPCSYTFQQKDGTYYPEKDMSVTFRKTSKLMGIYEGKSKEGCSLGKEWRENDGLVNTISSTYPFNQPYVLFDKDHVEKGKWNVFETKHYDHMAMIGGLIHACDVFPYYLECVEMISELYRNERK